MTCRTRSRLGQFTTSDSCLRVEASRDLLPESTCHCLQHVIIREVAGLFRPAASMINSLCHRSRRTFREEKDTLGADLVVDESQQNQPTGVSTFKGAHLRQSYTYASKMLPRSVHWCQISAAKRRGVDTPALKGKPTWPM